MTIDDPRLAIDKLFAGYDAQERLNSQQRRFEQLLVELLSVVDALHDLEQYCDGLERKGVQGVPRRSVEVVLRRLMGVLKSQQVEPMNCKGQPLDLERHEVIEVKDMHDMPDDVVLEESVRGYIGPNRVLRHAKVVISRAAARETGIDQSARKPKRSARKTVSRKKESKSR
jgi:molecular chaperone GrpE (heat shock protein)